MSNPLPRAFDKAFMELRRKVHRLYLRDWILIGFLSLFSALFLFIIIDRLFFITGWVRPAFFVLGFLGLLLLGPYRYFKKAYAQRHDEALTQIIKQKRARLGDRIQGAMEISKQDSGASKELQSAALEQVGNEVEQLELASVLPKLPHNYYLIGAGSIFSVLLLGLFLAPKQVTNATKRFFLPVADVERYSVISFEHVPDNYYVVKGQPSEFSIRLKGQAVTGEAIVAEGKLDGHAPVTAEYLDGFTFALPAVEKPTSFSILAGDAYRSLKIIPKPRPKITKITLRQKLPEYLGLEGRVLQPHQKRMQLLRGSTLQLEVESNELIEELSSSGGIRFQRGYKGTKRATSDKFTLEDAFSTELSYTDQYGLSVFPKRNMHFTPVEDQPPTSELIYKEKEFTLLPHETIELNLNAEDDFGVKAAYIRVDSLSRTSFNNRNLAIAGSPDGRSVSTQFLLNPEIQKLIPDSYRISAEVVDYLEGREPTTSQPITMHLLSYEAHASLIRTNFTNLLDKLDEFYQEALGHHYQNQMVARAYKREPHSYLVTNDLKAALKKERTALKSYRSVSDLATALSQDAFRNKKVDRSVQLSLTLLSQRLANDFPPRFDKEIDLYEKASLNRYSFPIREAYLDEALSVESQTLSDLRKLINDMREVDRRFEASSFVQRIQEVANNHDTRANLMMSDYDDYVGKLVSDLSPGQAQRNIDFISAQIQDLGTLSDIETDLRNYAAFTEKVSFAMIADQISSSDIYRQMQLLEKTIGTNQRYQAVLRIKDIADQLQKLANELNGEVSGGGAAGGGGGGGANQSQQEQDAEFMFRIMEIIREQQNLRGKTRALDQQKKFIQN